MIARRGRIRGVGGHDRVALDAGWQVCAAPPGAAAAPAAGWIDAAAPTTAAGALGAAGAWSLDGPARRFDAETWWWRRRLDEAAAGQGGAAEELVLGLDGLATLAEVWIDGELVLSSDDMFVAHELAVAPGARELVIRCRSVDEALRARRPRPRWRAPMIEHQQLRWIRATLLGRTPGWSPPAAAVGPWRPVWLERRRGVDVDGAVLRARVDGAAGRLEVTCRARAIGGGAAPGGELVVERDGRTWRAPLAAGASADGWTRLDGAVDVADVVRWWPHTHGEPACYRARLVVGGADVDLGPIGFRELTVDTAGGGFAIAVNGARVFCRGACWTPLDPVTLAATPAAQDAAVAQAAAAGMNMLRVGGTMVYEDDAFLDACDARGVLLWQDLMFANMDYPEDAAFEAACVVEVGQQAARWAGRPALAVVCGSSEGEQQAAMWGAPRALWSPRLFHEVLPAAVAAACPDAAYWPSSAHGGAFPHGAHEGTTSYYGVGAYLRPLEDARRAEVRFASECLAFANVPGPAGLAELPGGPGAKVHHPGWKARTPRDLGAGWDFDDVRDHYVAALYRVDPTALRWADHDRYLALGRVATGEVMAATFAEWRRARSTCAGGLVWLLRDLWPGAGWGVVDSAGRPKPAWHVLRRALAPVAVAITDEGGSGLALHVVNDRGAPLRGEVELALWRAGEVAVGGGRRAIEVPAHGAIELAAGALTGGFVDLSYAYRFGPPPADLVVATLRDAAGAALAEAFHFPAGRPSARELDVGLAAEAAPRPDGGADLTVTTRRFAQAVTIEIDGLAADDDCFHLAPGASRTVRLRPVPGAAPRATRRGAAVALNAETAARFTVGQSPPA